MNLDFLKNEEERRPAVKSGATEHYYGSGTSWATNCRSQFGCTIDSTLLFTQNCFNSKKFFIGQEDLPRSVISEARSHLFTLLFPFCFHGINNPSFFPVCRFSLLTHWETCDQLVGHDFFGCVESRDLLVSCTFLINGFTLIPHLLVFSILNDSIVTK